MSMIYCPTCGKSIDTDFDAEHFQEHWSEWLQARVDAKIQAIHDLMARPGVKPLTSMQMKAQADRRRDTVVTLKLNRSAIRREFE
jgi:hypothetical protein